MSSRWKLIVIGLAVLGVLSLLELRVAERPSCTPGTCPLTRVSDPP